MASVFVPLLKLLILIFLLLSVQLRSAWRPRERTRLYRITETIGRWSMVDVYVVTILVALVRLGNLASVEAEAGAIFFLRGRGHHHARRHVIRSQADLGCPGAGSACQETAERSSSRRGRDAVGR